MMTTARDVAVGARLARLEEQVNSRHSYDWRNFILSAMGLFVACVAVVAGSYFVGHRLIDAEVTETQKVRLQLQDEYAGLRRETESLALANERTHQIITDLTLASTSWMTGLGSKQVTKYLDRAQSTLENARAEATGSTKAAATLDGVERTLTLLRGELGFQTGNLAWMRAAGATLCRDDEHSSEGNALLAFDSLAELSRVPTDEMRSRCRRQLETASNGVRAGIEQTVYLALISIDQGDFDTAISLAKAYDGPEPKGDADLIRESHRAWTFAKLADGIEAMAGYLKAPNKTHVFPLLQCQDRFYALNTFEGELLTRFFERLQQRVVTADQGVKRASDQHRFPMNDPGVFTSRLLHAINLSAGGCVAPIEAEPTPAEEPRLLIQEQHASPITPVPQTPPKQEPKKTEPERRSRSDRKSGE
jgi:hypothetical protein